MYREHEEPRRLTQPESESTVYVSPTEVRTRGPHEEQDVMVKKNQI